MNAPVPVTPDNFARAETDLYFGNAVREGGFGKFHHFREPMPIDHQSVVRANRDTLYSSAVFDLDAGPVTVILPDAGKRFMSLQVFDEDQYTVQVAYRAGRYTFDRASVGTRYIMAGIRTLVNPDDPADLAAVHAVQDSLASEQAAPGAFEPSSWDKDSQDKVRKALVELGTTLPDTKGMFGRKDQVDPVLRLIGSAMAWGGNPETEALYLNVTPPKNDGKAVYRLRVKDVPVDGFWSVSVYNAEGYYEANDRNAYTLNSITAKTDPDGAVTIQFGGAGDAPNLLPITPGWNYMVRLYRPRPEVLDGSWTFPEATEV
ncbi:DUF1254 domain-containing protein [Brevundimonas lenta]|uniref:Carboxylesterase n=1 Tax=Brevundimonas lenta TaxID=424796 RepID=A0A7W6JDT3_9CAUL|nr:DUF1254 domain-containing protein [Brevundimonas lenta]MBB4083274.1 hypothetical protein [Brevundimonas lenta]